jgi:hypothetical protein
MRTLISKLYEHLASSELSMASPSQVRTYLAQWFQLGKRVVSQDGQHHYLPSPIFSGEEYSPNFEWMWSQISARNADRFYLEGTDQSIADLLSPRWQIESCARCQMPVPTSHTHWTCAICPCSDLTTWPNESLPKPRSPIQTQTHLRTICSRLQQSEQRDRVMS